MKENEVYFCPKCGRIVSREMRSAKQYAAACTYCDEDFFSIELKKKGIIFPDSFSFSVLNFKVVIEKEEDNYVIRAQALNTHLEYIGYYDDDGGSILGDELNMPEDCKQIEETILKVFYKTIKGVPVSLEAK